MRATPIMPTTKVNRFYYRHGQLHQQIPYRNGLLHGTWRTWHRNGVLASAESYANGKLHGICRQWADDGRLLGEFRMHHGTGIQWEWFDDGEPAMELSTVDGAFTGRTRTWMRDGTLRSEKFYISARVVSRRAYLQAAQAQPNWPRYRGQRAGRPAKNNRSLAAKQFRLLIEWLLQQPVQAEAREWLNAANGPRNRRCLGRFKSAKAARELVEKLYDEGSPLVIVPSIYGRRNGPFFADSLLVQLPKEATKRHRLRQFCRQFAKAHDAACEPEHDLGEEYRFFAISSGEKLGVRRGPHDTGESL